MSIVDLNAQRCVPLNIEDDPHWVPYEKANKFLPMINPINFEFKTNKKTTEVKSRPISFYENTSLLVVRDKTWKEEWAIFYFLSSGDDYHQIGGAADNLWIINKSLRLNLKKHTVIDYLKFFCFFFVYTDAGSFFVIEDKNSEFIDLLPVSNKLEKQRIEKLLTPVEVEGPDNKGNFTIECDMIHGGDLFRTKFVVSAKEGSVEMVDDKLLVGFAQ